MRPEPRLAIPHDIDRAVMNAVKYSDRGEKGLRAWAAYFCAAHYRQPYGLSVEVGTNIGGSALLFGQLLELMYGPHGTNIPSLWTVDPYGSKPYVGGHGDRPEDQPPIYTDEFYQAMKANLHGAAYHAHWLMPSTEFFRRLHALPYWRPGEKTVGALEVGSGATIELRVGESRAAQDCSFILLDGEHSADSIVCDLMGEGPAFGGALKWLGPAGTVVIDNIDTDPNTVLELSRRIAMLNFHGPNRYYLDASNREWAIVTRDPGAA